MPKIHIAAIPVNKGTGYPPEFDALSAERLRQHLGAVGGLTGFGVNLTEGMKKLAPPQPAESGIDAVIEEIEHEKQADKFVEKLRHKLRKGR